MTIGLIIPSNRSLCGYFAVASSILCQTKDKRDKCLEKIKIEKNDINQFLSSDEFSSLDDPTQKKITELSKLSDDQFKQELDKLFESAPLEERDGFMSFIARDGEYRSDKIANYNIASPVKILGAMIRYKIENDADFKTKIYNISIDKENFFKNQFGEDQYNNISENELRDLLCFFHDIENHPFSPSPTKNLLQKLNDEDLPNQHPEIYTQESNFLVFYDAPSPMAMQGHFNLLFSSQEYRDRQLELDIKGVSDFVPPASNTRGQEVRRNTSFYQLMHDTNDNKIEKIFKQTAENVIQPITINLPSSEEDKRGEDEIVQVTNFTFDNAIIEEAIKNKSKVVRFYDGNDETRGNYYDKRDNKVQCDDYASGVRSSYIVRTDLFFGQNLGLLPEEQRPKIYCTGFCLPQFNNAYCNKFFELVNHDDELKDLLKSAFKLQIYATLEARQQQIDDREIKSDVKVPLILNKPHEFIRGLPKERVDKIRDLTKQALNELFNDNEIKSAINGKINRVFLFDKPKEGELAHDPNETNEANKAFFLCEQEDFGDGIKMHRMPNKDILDLARKYYDRNRIRIAVPVMKHPTAKDGNGMDCGSRAMEESLAMQSGYFFPAYLNPKYNAQLKPAEAINFTKFCEHHEYPEAPTTPKALEALEAPEAPPYNETSNSGSIFENKGFQGAVIGGAIGVGLFTTAVACGVVVAPVAVVSAVAVGIIASSALAGAVVYPKITQLCEQQFTRK